MAQRTQITLDPELQRLARRRAADRGISFAEYVRTLVARDLERSLPAVDRSMVFNLGDSGGSDVARHKDEYIADAIEAGRIPARVQD